MKLILFILVFLNVMYSGYAQPLIKDSLYLKVAKEYIIKSTTHEIYKGNAQLKDTNNIAYIIPIYNLTDSFCKDKNDYSRISPFINNIYDPYNQYAFIKQEKNICVLTLTKSIHQYLRNHTPMSPSEEYEYAVSQISPNTNFGELYSDYDENIKFNQIEKYIKENPDAKVFQIYELSGFWAYKNGKLIKLIFHKDKTQEIDGEHFYRHYLLIRSPKGLERVTKKYEHFIIVITV